MKPARELLKSGHVSEAKYEAQNYGRSETLKKFHWSLALPSSRPLPRCSNLPAEFPPPRVPKSTFGFTASRFFRVAWRH